MARTVHFGICVQKDFFDILIDFSCISELINNPVVWSLFPYEDRVAAGEIKTFFLPLLS